MKVIDIKIKDSAGAVETLAEAELKAGAGIAGDHHQAKCGRELSILDLKTARQASEKKGLCTGRFIPNILLDETDGIDADKQYRVGQAVIRITRRGKKCFPKCPLVKGGSQCGLHENAIFADVVKSGFIKTGDCLIQIDDKVLI